VGHIGFRGTLSRTVILVHGKRRAMELFASLLIVSRILTPVLNEQVEVRLGRMLPITGSA
jgi:hypothetical protein